MTITRIMSNKIRCKLCGDVIESKTIDDYVTCSCGACSISGGNVVPKRHINYTIETLDDVLEDLCSYSQFKQVI